MWSIISNPVVTHLTTALIGAAVAWYMGHRTASKAIETAITAAVAALKKDAGNVGAAVGAATTAIKKDI
jgi:hypothetical protein